MPIISGNEASLMICDYLQRRKLSDIVKITVNDQKREKAFDAYHIKKEPILIALT